MSDPATPGEGALTPAVFHVLLALVDDPLHGYGVMLRAEEDSGMVMGPGTVYGTLQRLQEKGWVEDAGEDETEGRRRRRFCLTPAGRAALATEARRLERLAALSRRHRLAGGGAP